MQLWNTPKPLAVPIAFDSIKRIDLEFVNVHRDTGSFTAFVFLNAKDLSPKAGRDHDRFAGSFSVFAPEECWGGEGHCDWERGPVSAFDQRPLHHLSPINVSMDVTEAALRLGDPKRLSVTVHAARTSEPKLKEGVLRFDELTVLAYA
jgi:hypothetical protein